MWFAEAPNAWSPSCPKTETPVALIDPSEDVRHHLFLADVIEQVVVMALIEFEGFVRRTRIVVERLAPARLSSGRAKLSH